MPLTIDEPEKMLYLIRCNGGACKIGVSKEPETRLKQLQKANPKPLELVATVETVENGSKTVEKLFHEYYEADHIHGEWFDLADRDIEAFKLLRKVSAHDIRTLIGEYETAERADSLAEIKIPCVRVVMGQ